MYRLLQTLSAGAAAAVLITGVIAGSARFARSQQSDSVAASDSGAPSGSGIASQPDSRAPLDLNGCWSGTLEDVYAGSGPGYLNFAQSGHKLLPPSTGSGYNMGFNWTSGNFNSQAYGVGKGTATPRVFHEGIHYKTEKGCAASIIGTLTGSTLTGAYKFTKVCAKHNGFGPHAGTFSMTFDASNNSCN